MLTAIDRYDSHKENLRDMLKRNFSRIKNFSRYAINKNGQVYSVHRNRKMKPRPDGRYHLISDAGKRMKVKRETLELL